MVAGVDHPDVVQRTRPHTGMAVVCQDGMLGYVERSLPTWQPDRPTHIVVRVGEWAQHSMIVPVHWTVRVTATQVLLKVRKRRIARLARYQKS
jgi:hypothetical protein